MYTYYGCLEASYLEGGEVDQLRNGILEYAYYATSRVRGLCLEEGEVDQLEQDRLLLGRVRPPHGEET